MKFFLDESGSTGDVAKVRGTLNFGQQPVFTLAAVGCRDDAALATELRRLAVRHEAVGPELSARTLAAALPDVARDLASYLDATDSPLFIEMVDKRFLVIINLLNTLLLPPVMGFDEGEKAIPLRQVVAEVIARSLPDAVLIAYARACETTDREDVATTFSLLATWAQDPARGEFGGVLQAMVADSRADFVAATDPDAHRRFLPLPDTSVTGRSVAMLPGLSSLTNIYARINKYRRGRLAEVILVHDEHMLFGDILQDAKALMEKLAADDMVPALPHADYKLRESASLVFAASSEPGIQAADVLAGFVMRYFRDASMGRQPTSAAIDAMATIMQLTDIAGSRGINLVADDAFLARAGFR